MTDSLRPYAQTHVVHRSFPAWVCETRLTMSAASEMTVGAVRLGSDVLLASPRLHGARVGIVCNHASADGTGVTSDEEVARARKAVEWSRYYEEARELAGLLTTWSLTLGPTHDRFVVTSGGGPGIMEAANRGATDAGGKTIGLNIRLPFEQGPNPYITEGLHFEFQYFFMRKFWFAYLAKALVIFPGGFGTLDEMFDILTLMQTDKLAENIQIILYGADYWDRVLNFESLLDAGAIAASDIRLLDRADTPQQAFNLLTGHLTTHHLPPAAAQKCGVPGIAKTRL